jgi:hypothetical protein
MKQSYFVFFSLLTWIPFLAVANIFLIFLVLYAYFHGNDVLVYLTLHQLYRLCVTWWTEHDSWVANTPASFSGGLWFKSQPRVWLSDWGFSWFSSPSRQMG